MCKKVHMENISKLVIPPGSKTGKKAKDYRDYLKAYRKFAKEKQAFAPKSNVKVDSQFSERLAADCFGFDVDHCKDLDGINPATNETYEVKATGFINNKVRFNPSKKANHVIWIKVNRESAIIREISGCVYSELDSNGFIDLDTFIKEHPEREISKMEYSY